MDLTLVQQHIFIKSSNFAMITITQYHHQPELELGMSVVTLAMQQASSDLYKNVTTTAAIFLKNWKA